MPDLRLPSLTTSILTCIDKRDTLILRLYDFWSEFSFFKIYIRFTCKRSIPFIAIINSDRAFLTIFIFPICAPLTYAFSFITDRSAILASGFPTAVISPASEYFSIRVPERGLFTMLLLICSLRVALFASLTESSAITDDF